jgi:hypothetical protein
MPMPTPSTPKRTLSLKRHLICELGYHDRLLASEGWSLWTCDMQERPDPLTPIEEIERQIEIEVERELTDFPNVEIERERPRRAD